MYLLERKEVVRAICDQSRARPNVQDVLRLRLDEVRLSLLDALHLIGTGTWMCT
jgi:hypothetical protein